MFAKASSISWYVASLGNAKISTLGVKISITSKSPNSIALLINSLSSSVIFPSSSASSTKVINSSSVIPSSSFALNTLEIKSCHFLNI